MYGICFCIRVFLTCCIMWYDHVCTFQISWSATHIYDNLALQRTVMEAVTAVLGGGLRVGVILHGKKVRDDSKTLLQTGISHDNHLDALGFALEPNFSQNLPPACATSSLRVPSADMPQPFMG